MSENTDNTSEVNNYFKDRESNHSNRRKLKIVSQTPNEIIVDIERLDEKTGEDGTPLNATTFNEIFAQITAAEKGSVVEVKNVNGVYEAKDIQFDSDPQTQINERVKTSDLLNKIYPIGSIYMSTVNTNPADLLGGAWVELQDRFLIGAGNTYELGATGGESTHVLTVNEMPSHTHAQNAHSHTQAQHNHNFEVGTGYYNDDYKGNNSKAPTGTQANRVNGNYYNTSSSTPTINSTTATNQNTGGGQAHNNMPPYLAVYMWKRTA